MKKALLVVSMLLRSVVNLSASNVFEIAEQLQKEFGVAYTPGCRAGDVLNFSPADKDSKFPAVQMFSGKLPGNGAVRHVRSDRYFEQHRLKRVVFQLEVLTEAGYVSCTAENVESKIQLDNRSESDDRVKQLVTQWMQRFGGAAG